MTEEKQEPTEEEELRKAWEARLAKNARAKTVYVNSDTGRRMDTTESLYDIRFLGYMLENFQGDS